MGLKGNKGDEIMSNPVKPFATPTEFATFGTGAIAYVRRVKSDEFNRSFPAAQDLPEGLDLWGLFGADGKPLSVSDDQYSVLEDAQNRELLTVHRH